MPKCLITYYYAFWCSNTDLVLALPKKSVFGGGGFLLEPERLVRRRKKRRKRYRNFSQISPPTDNKSHLSVNHLILPCYPTTEGFEQTSWFNSIAVWEFDRECNQLPSISKALTICQSLEAHSSTVFPIASHSPSPHLHYINHPRPEAINSCSVGLTFGHRGVVLIVVLQ